MSGLGYVWLEIVKPANIKTGIQGIGLTASFLWAFEISMRSLSSPLAISFTACRSLAEVVWALQKINCWS